ncbi:hypothetical protein BC938DRAFT_473240 [Jimgerdemannia flammicorona]|uniref:Gag1-like clamp domain-containing protein n=1 Tax=Jimgerdemannia flammicorona TaxID=994334 RepID=A0A433Q4D4_9FUNG|nr:hypothetical protein BC938DRAFT_473240 [Jimgerdemannia flammicorona]
MATLLHTFPSTDAAPAGTTTDAFARPQDLLPSDASFDFTTAATVSAASTSTSTAEPPNDDNATPMPTEGLDFWNRRREEWTRGQWRQAVDSENKHNPALAHITDHNIHAIYDSLVNERKRLIKPIPLPNVVCERRIKVLVSGWKRDGVWPANMDAPRDSS